MYPTVPNTFFPVDALGTDCPMHVKGYVCLPRESMFSGAVQPKARYLSPVYAHWGQYCISECLLGFYMSWSK